MEVGWSVHPASALLLMEAGTASRLGVRPLQRLASLAVAGVEPDVMGISPIPAMRKALERAGVGVGELAAAVRASWVPPRQALARRVRGARHGRACPACQHLATVTGRTADLLARSLGDPATRERYARAVGVGMRDLPLALSFCRDATRSYLLLETARSRLEVLLWELQELQRKINWSVRYEPKGTAPARAVAQVTGVCPVDSPFIGLD